MRYKLFFAIALGVILAGCEEPVKNNLNIQTITIVEPTDGAVNNMTVTNFNWDDLLGVDHYEIEVATPDFSEEEFIIITEQVQRSNFVSTLAQGSYAWRVKAVNNQTETPFSMAIFSIDTTLNLGSKTVNIIHPLNNTVVNTDSVLIQWENVSMANEYNLIIEEAASSAVMTNQVLTATQYFEGFDEGTYHIKVKAMNDVTSTAYTTHTFVVDLTPPTPPIITSPLNGAVVTSPVELRWNNHLSAVEDSIFIYFTQAAISPIKRFSSVSQSVFFTAASNTYYWRLKSYDAAGNVSPPSALQSFTIQ